MASAASKAFAEYSRKLEQLTLNSRPIIMELTELAYEQAKRNFAHVVVEAIETRIYKVSDRRSAVKVHLAT